MLSMYYTGIVTIELNTFCREAIDVINGAIISPT